MRIWLIPLALSFLCPATSLAFAPTEAGLEGFEPQRLRTYHWGKQARLKQAPSWVEFQAGAGADWLARFDEKTGTPFVAWGPPILLDDTSDEAAVEASLRDFMASYEGLVGVDERQLSMTHAGYIERTDTWYVQFDQVLNDIPIRNASVELRIRHGALVQFAAKTAPKVNWQGAAELSSETAIELAIEDGPAPNADHTIDDSLLVFYAMEEDGAIVTPLAWEVTHETQSPRGIWTTWINAETGELIGVRNDVRYLQGTLTAYHDTRTVDGDYTTSPVPAQRLENSTNYVYTGDDGSFSLDGSSLTAEMQGQWFRVQNQTGDNAEYTFNDTDPMWTEDDATIAEIDSYIFLHQVRDWGVEFAPEVGIVGNKVTSKVNINSNCNAYYDGSVNFYSKGGGCNNTGRIADVNYHEWGHGFHYYSLETGSYDGSLGEGAADTVSFLLTDDEVIAPYFMTSGSGIRNVADDRVYPDDWVGEVHYDGLIFAGAVWDFWKALEEDGDDEEAWNTTSQIFADALKSGPTVPESYDAFVLADDDDGDLSNGTPNLCGLIEAFSIHGLGPGGDSVLAGIEHIPVANQQASLSGYNVDASLVNMASSCMEMTIESGTVHYSADDGATWYEAPMTAVDEVLSGEIPAVQAGTIVHYYITIETTDGDDLTAPEGGSITPLSFFVGDLVELYCEDFEDDDGGYTHQLLDGEETEGADDWQWGSPNGYAGDPTDAYSGTKIWGNDLGGGNYNGEYQNEKHNRLTSSLINAGPYGDLILQFQRWLTVEDGYYDHARVLNGDTQIWENHGTVYEIGDEHHEDSQWSKSTHFLGNPDAQGNLQVSWDIVSDQGLSFGGWNIDDVCVYAPLTGANALIIDDFTASDGEDYLNLSWTNPDVSDLAEVRVVWASDAYPEDVSDGTEVYSDTNPTPGEAISANDDTANTDVRYYTVFAQDGDGNWTAKPTELYNADTGYASGEVSSDLPSVLSGPGCGCSQAGGPASAGLTALLLGLFGLTARRRQQEVL